MARPSKFPPTLYTTPNGIDYIRIVIGGVRRTITCGPHGSQESAQKYGRLCAELKNGHAVGPKCPDLTVEELVAAWNATVPQRFRPDSPSPRAYDDAFAPLRTLYGAATAREFGPKALKAVRQAMIDHKLSRKVINRRVVRVKTLFKWATEEELVPGGVYQSLQAVRALPPQTPGVRETPGVPTVSWEEVKRVYRRAPRIPGRMFLVQFFTGMRSGEVRVLRPCDLDRSGPVWAYRPSKHKNQWRGQDRVVAVGPQAQAVLRPFLGRCRSAAAYLFDPRQEPRGRATRDHYREDTYGRAIGRAAKRAGVDCRAYSARHGRKQIVTRQHGSDAARAVLGQKSLESTAIYGTIDLDRAAEVARQCG